MNILAKIFLNILLVAVLAGALTFMIKLLVDVNNGVNIFQ